MGTTDLAAVLFGQTRRRLLSWLYSHPDESFYLRELHRRTQVGQGALQRELKILTSAGILERTTRGRHVFFSVRRDSPIFNELRSIITKTSGINDVLKNALQPVAARVVAAFIFGSVARGNENRRSDVDIAVIGDVTFGEVVEHLAEAQQTIGREINPVVMSLPEFKAKLTQGQHFVQRLMEEEKLFVLGGEGELNRLAHARLADGPSHQPKRNQGHAQRPRARSKR